MRKYAFLVPLALGAVLAAGVVLVAGQSGDDDDAVMAPMFEVDPLWPKNLPNHWLMGPTIGVDVDAQDNIWVLHRNTPNNFQGATEIGMVMDPPVSECCQPGPPVLVFDQEGNLVNSWGGPGTETGDYVWPESNHGIAVDHMGNVWIGGNGQGDAHVLKFTRSGEFLLQAGRHNARMVREEDGRRIFERDSLSEDSYGRVAEIGIDPEANEAYFADGYYNKRVAVVDIETGAFKRGWGAYGNVPDDDYDFGGPYEPGNDPAQQFRGPVHCSVIANDGLVYVCDRAEDRVQVFQKDGTFVDEMLVGTHTRAQGSTWDLDFSPDEEQTYMYLADGQNMKVYIIERKTLKVLTAFGDGGRQPGMFFAVHSIAVDSSGNIYTTETYEGSRVQKFVYKGMGPVPEGAEGEKSQGVLWPTN